MPETQKAGPRRFWRAFHGTRELGVIGADSSARAITKAAREHNLPPGTIRVVSERSGHEPQPSPDSLSEAERTRLAECEATIEAGLATFFQVGTALAKVRDERLYRETHTTFEDYCKSQWDISKRRANQLISAMGVAESIQFAKCEAGQDLGTMVPTLRTPDSPSVTPTSERQVRPLASLPKPQQAAAWNQAVAESGGKAPTAKKVTEVVDRIVNPEGKTLVNGQHGRDKQVEAARKAGRIPADAVVEVTDPGEEATTIEAIAEEQAEREAIQAEAVEDPDEAFLASLPLSSVLEGVSLDTFRRDALFYRDVDELLKSLGAKDAIRKLFKLRNPSGKEEGRYSGTIMRWLKHQHPRDWKVCPSIENGGCGGAGTLTTGNCPKCWKKGYVCQ